MSSKTNGIAASHILMMLALVAFIPSMIQQTAEFSVAAFIPLIIAIIAIIQGVLERSGRINDAKRLGQMSTLINQKAVELIPFVQKGYNYVKKNDLNEQQRASLEETEAKLLEFNRIALEHLNLVTDVLKPEEQADSLELDRESFTTVPKRVRTEPHLVPKINK
jgi:hypothetical protein